MPKKVVKEKTPIVKKKRGRKPKNKTNEIDKSVPVVKKKRGRKPKGGKIITKDKLNFKKENIQNHNVILHLKCKKSSLTSQNKCNMKLNVTNYDPNINDPSAYNLNSNTKYPSLQSYEFQKVKIPNNTIESQTIKNLQVISNKSDNVEEEKNDNVNIKDIWLKLELLKNKLRHNNVSDKKSSCFWCTYSFDNPAVHIPINYNNDNYDVYGCFCSPECAVAFLKTENIDNSTLWERYALINNIYSKIFNYNKNIKPAPNPYYTLDKFYGNLNIQEYRKLLKNDRLLLIVDKPMTKILPELYEENNEVPNVFFNLLDNKKISKNSTDYRLKRKKTSYTKNEILSSTFNF
tara:strand:+ start:2145 stop:3185 length:1041 start_codon:yes stop_codon:yes gene_type:complete